MPKEYADLYSDLLSAKVTFPRERKFLDWPLNQNPSALLASAAMDSGDEGESDLNPGNRNNQQPRLISANSPVNQDRGAVGQSQNMNGGDPAQVYGDLTTRIRELKTIRTKLAEMVLSNPGHPSSLGFDSDLLREAQNYERALAGVKNHAQWNGLSRQSTTAGTAMHVFKKRALAEVALAEGLMDTYAVFQAMGNDESILQIGLIDNFMTHLQVDLASNPHLAGADLDVPGGSGLSQPQPSASGINNSGNSNQLSHIAPNRPSPSQQEEERRRAEEERLRKAREDEERERAKKLREEEERKRRAAEEAEAARARAEAAAREEKKRQDEIARLAEAALQKKKQEEEEERVAKMKAKQMEDELKQKDEQRRRQEEKRKISSESSDPYNYSVSNRGRDAADILRDENAYPSQRAKEPRLLSQSPFQSGDMPFSRYGERDESIKSAYKQVTEETAKLQDLRSQYSAKKSQPPSHYGQNQQYPESSNLPKTQMVSSANDLVKLFGSQTLLNKAISIEQERQAQQERRQKEREMEYIEKYEQMKQEGREREKADAEAVARLRQELAVLRERKKRSSVFQVARVLSDRERPETEGALHRMDIAEEDLLAELERLTKLRENIGILHADINKESYFLLGKQKGTQQNVDKQRDLRAEIFALKQQKENLELQAMNLKRQLEDGPSNSWRDPEYERKQNLENSIMAMKRLNELKANELSRNKALLEQLDTEYRMFLKNPNYSPVQATQDPYHSLPSQDPYGVKHSSAAKLDEGQRSFVPIRDTGKSGLDPYSSTVGDFRTQGLQNPDMFGMTDFSRGLQEMLADLSTSKPRGRNN